MREGKVAAGEFLAQKPSVQFCWKANLEALHRETLERLKAEIEPLPLVEYQDFLLRWQHAHPTTRLKGREGLLQVIRHLDGYGEATDTAVVSDAGVVVVVLTLIPQVGEGEGEGEEGEGEGEGPGPRPPICGGLTIPRSGRPFTGLRGDLLVISMALLALSAASRKTGA